MLDRPSPRANLESLRRNPYPGRGIVLGAMRSGHVAMIYWIMGRSENSRNRIFERDGGRVYTVAADPAKVSDPSLIIYNAMRDDGKAHYVVSNGHQTDDAIEGLVAGKELQTSLRRWSYEPDAPNFTPRITGRYSFGAGRKYPFELSIVRRNAKGEQESLYVPYDAEPEVGRCVTTYSGDGDPLPSFQGEPVEMPLVGSADDIAYQYWYSLNEDHRVALAVKLFNPKDGHTAVRIINKYKKVA